MRQPSGEGERSRNVQCGCLGDDRRLGRCGSYGPKGEIHKYRAHCHSCFPHTIFLDMRCLRSYHHRSPIVCRYCLKPSRLLCLFTISRYADRRAVLLPACFGIPISEEKVRASLIFFCPRHVPSFRGHRPLNAVYFRRFLFRIHACRVTPAVVAKAARSGSISSPPKLPKSINSPYSLKNYANNVTKGSSYRDAVHATSAHSVVGKQHLSPSSTPCLLYSSGVS